MKKSFLALFSALLLFFSGGAQVVNVSGDITTNTTWTNNNIYMLTGGFVYITNNAVLTIQPGTLIKGNASALVITRGAKIIADGTPTQPIVFTSFQPSGWRQSGDWGGILILGKASINDPAGERLAEGGIDPVKGLYGGAGVPDDNDSSGVLRYVRIEYGGIAFQPNNETNGLTMGGVGRKTVIDYVQVSYCGDDGFEWFGGTVNASHLIVNKTLDDMFDSDYGWRGNVQFFLAVSDSNIADISLSNGFESDNDATGTTNSPLTKPIFSNGTIIGPRMNPPASWTQNSNFGRALHLRRSTSTCVYNTVFTGFKRGLKIEHANTVANVTGGGLEFKNNIIAGCGVPPYSSDGVLDSSGLSFGMLNWFNSNSNSILTNSQDIMLNNAYSYTAPDFLPKAGSPLLSGASFSSANINNSFFTPTTYRGAFGTTDWTKCWANFNPQAEAYNIVPINNTVSTPTVTAIGPTNVCQGSAVVLNSTTGTSYLWSNGATTASISAAASGNYNVTVFNAAGCSATSTGTSVTIFSLPTASITVSGSTTICQGGSVTLTANSATGYQWSTGATSQAITAALAGNYNVTVTDANGCTGTSVNTGVTVNVLPTASVTAGGPTVFCTGDSVMLSSNAASSYLWSNGATTSSIYVSASGNYHVSVTDANGCTSAASNVVAVSVSSAPPPTITMTGSTTICQGEMVTLCASASDSYSWSTGATTQCIIVSSAGNYNVTVTNMDPCDGTGTSANVSVTVNALPVPAFTSNATAQPTVSFTNSSTGATGYVWDFGDGSFSTLQNPSHIYASNSSYTVCLTATNAAGCSDSICQVITLNVGVEEIQPITAAVLYPNPAREMTTLEFYLQEGNEVIIEITDLTGKVEYSLIGEFGSGSNRLEIPTAQLPNGIYMTSLRIQDSGNILKLVVLK